MKVRGERECQDCGHQWSYYETGRVNCPSCGSLRSVGVSERAHHTASAATLDLDPVRADVDSASVGDLATAAGDVCRSYLTSQGFIDGGDLRPLSDTYLAASELRHVANRLAGAMRPTEDEEFYFLTLLRGADDGERPDAETVPESMRDARGLAAAAAVAAYGRDVRTVLEETPDQAARQSLQRLAEHRKRVEALDGDVAVATADTLVSTVRDVGSYVRHGDEAALAAATDRLDGLEADTP
jgi:uncharacterized Zn finger protein (UPF0148 family)